MQKKPVDLETFRILEKHFPLITVEIILYDETGYYLLVRRVIPPSKGLWTLPGGLIHRGEHFYPAVKRICHYELGVSTTPLKLLTPRTYLSEGRHSVGIPILCRGYSEEPVQLNEEEHDLYHWFLRGQPPSIFSPEEGLVRIELEPYYESILKEAELL